MSDRELVKTHKDTEQGRHEHRMVEAMDTDPVVGLPQVDDRIISSGSHVSM